MDKPTRQPGGNKRRENKSAQQPVTAEVRPIDEREVERQEGQNSEDGSYIPVHIYLEEPMGGMEFRSISKFWRESNYYLIL